MYYPSSTPHPSSTHLQPAAQHWASPPGSQPPPFCLPHFTEHRLMALTFLLLTIYLFSVLVFQGSALSAGKQLIWTNILKSNASTFLQWMETWNQEASRCAGVSSPSPVTADASTTLHKVGFQWPHPSVGSLNTPVPGSGKPEVSQCYCMNWSLGNEKHWQCPDNYAWAEQLLHGAPWEGPQSAVTRNQKLRAIHLTSGWC